MLRCTIKKYEYLNSQDIIYYFTYITRCRNTINAGVKWFIPSEYGADDEDPIATTIPTIATKVDLIKLLKTN